MMPPTMLTRPHFLASAGSMMTVIAYGGRLEGDMAQLARRYGLRLHPGTYE